MARNEFFHSAWAEVIAASRHDGAQDYALQRIAWSKPTRFGNKIVQSETVDKIVAVDFFREQSAAISLNRLAVSL